MWVLHPFAAFVPAKGVGSTVCCGELSENQRLSRPLALDAAATLLSDQKLQAGVTVALAFKAQRQ